MFALAGVPPSIGFTGKLLLFTSAMNSGYFWLVLIGAVNGTVSLYYYLRVLYAAYFKDDPSLGPVALSLPTKLLNIALAAIIIGFGIFPDRIVELAKAAVQLRATLGSPFPVGANLVFALCFEFRDKKSRPSLRKGGFFLLVGQASVPAWRTDSLPRIL